MQRTRLDGEFGKIRTGTQTNLRFCRLPIRPRNWAGPTNTGPVAKPSGPTTRNTVPTGLSGPAVHVHDRFTHGHGKASSPRSSTHETYTMASQEQLENTRITGKSDPYSQLCTLTYNGGSRKKMSLQANHYTQ